MRGVSTKLWASVNERTVFVGYRWLAWALAGLLLLSRESFSLAEGSGAWLLILTALVNSALTVWRGQYVLFARQHPLVLTLDCLFGLVLIWFSGGWQSPFQVYAFSSLVLPALLWGWQGGLASAAAIIAGNLVSLRYGAVAPPQLLADQVSTMVNLAAPLSLALLLPPVYRRARIRGRVLSQRAASSQYKLSERRPLRELHDNVFQHLSVANRQATQLPKRAAADEPVPAQLGAVHAAAAPGSQDLRRIIFGPTPSCDVTLDKALSQMIQGFGRHSSVVARLNIVGQPVSIPPVMHNTLVRLAQEALLNVEQHARASAALVSLRCDQQVIVLTIQDDGVGLLDGTHQRPGLHALRAVSYRLAELGGRLEVSDGESGGLTVRGRVPLTAAALDE